MQVEALVAFVKAREQIRINREAGLPREQWTSDPIFQKYRFCNVRREDDRVTRWIRENWRDPYADSELLWFGMMVARLFNDPAVLKDLRVPPAARAWNPGAVLRALNDRRDAGGRVFNPAYMLRSDDAVRKTDYAVSLVLTPAWKNRRSLAYRDGEPLAAFAERLCALHGMGGFLAGQVIADAKHGTVMRGAPDWSTWAVSGPGSRRGMNRVIGRRERAGWRESEWLTAVQEVRRLINPMLGMSLDAQDTQNCLCEFGKYERARLGEGRPKQLFVPLDERSA